MRWERTSPLTHSLQRSYWRTCAVNWGELQSSGANTTTHCKHLQFGSGTASNRFKPCSSSVRHRNMSVVELVSDHLVPSWRSATVTGEFVTSHCSPTKYQCGSVTPCIASCLCRCTVYCVCVSLLRGSHHRTQVFLSLLL